MATPTPGPSPTSGRINLEMMTCPQSHYRKSCSLPWCPNFKKKSQGNDQEEGEPDLEEEQRQSLTKYYPFPKDAVRQAKWIQELHMEGVFSPEVLKEKEHYICEEHFEESKHVVRGIRGTPVMVESGTSFLSRLAVPSKNLEGRLYTFFNREGNNKNVVVKRETPEPDPPICCVVGCRRQYADIHGAEVGLYKFPSDEREPNRFLQWVKRVLVMNRISVRNAWFGKYDSKEEWAAKYICSEHFTLDALILVDADFYAMFKLRGDAIPFEDEVIDNVLNGSLQTIPATEDNSEDPDNSLSDVGSLEMTQNFDESDSQLATQNIYTKSLMKSPTSRTAKRRRNPDVITLSDSEKEEVSPKKSSMAKRSPVKTSLPKTPEIVKAGTVINSILALPSPSRLSNLPDPRAQDVKINLPTNSGSSSVNSTSDLPLHVKCYILDAIRQTHVELCEQFNLSRSEMAQLWDKRKSILSTIELGEDD